ncbi:unnamed protein product [Sphenostylis stenocarpa]|uniref:Uncharacterized protein n=1 Tax=Sphenostylis stenocarpa TaxID=92480 RepID=A0AA86SNJ5_9FABA|nr:unnamed protein product [Sphenostylis stenocarpa]
METLLQFSKVEIFFRFHEIYLGSPWLQRMIPNSISSPWMFSFLILFMCSWQTPIKMVLLGKNKFGFVNCSIHELPMENPNHVAQHCNNIIASRILNSLTKEMQTNALHYSTAMTI